MKIIKIKHIPVCGNGGKYPSMPVLPISSYIMLEIFVVVSIFEQTRTLSGKSNISEVYCF
jgi:hypothetical protein